SVRSSSPRKRPIVIPAKASDRHPRESGDPETYIYKGWIPASAGMTMMGAGMTMMGAGMTTEHSLFIA
ncbi:MAG: hypothetical protein KKA99_02090, partial [Gammaproteobacteria bacterium]|nr:hypothetical protein [Gammaproteobacteria bacterium]